MAIDNYNSNLAPTGTTTQAGASLAAQVAAAARPPVSLTPIRTAGEIAQPQVTLPSPTPVTPSSSPPPITLPEISQRFHALTLADRRIAGEMAYWAFRLWQANDWERVGARDEEEFTEKQGLPWKTWSELVSLGNRLQHLSLPEMQSLTRAAMTALTRVHSSIWNEYAWVEEAKLVPPREFTMLVVQRNREAGVGLAAPAEPRTELALRVPLSQRPVLERRLETLRRQHHLSSPADALIYALESVDRAGELEDVLGEVRREMEELQQTYQAAAMESPVERDIRAEDGGATRQSLSVTAVRAQKLAGKILRTIKQAGVAITISEEVSDAVPTQTDESGQM